MLDQGLIKEIVKRIVQNYHPQKMLLFGSYANGTETEDSDLDLLVVKENKLPRYKRSREVKALLRGLKFPIDVMVYTPKEIQKWEDVENPITKNSESKRVIRFKEKGIKPMICNQTNSISITKATGVKFMEDSIGKKITLFVATIMDNKTKENIDCIRIREKKPKLPDLLPSDVENWQKVKSALLNDFTIDRIRTKWSVSKENELKLNDETSI